MAIMDLFTSLQTIINERSAKKVRQSIHDGIFRANQVVDANKNLVDQVSIRQEAVEQYNNQMITEMTDKDVISAPEIIQARGGKATLGQRLDETTAQLAQMATYVPLDKYSHLYDGEDITQALLTAIDEAPHGSEIVLNPDRQYVLSDPSPQILNEAVFVISKPITINFNNAVITINIQNKIVFDLFYTGHHDARSRIEMINYSFKTGELYNPISIIRTNQAINSKLDGFMSGCTCSHSLIWNWKGYGTHVFGEFRYNNAPRTIYMSHGATAEEHSFAFYLDVDITGTNGRGIELEGGGGEIYGVIEDCDGGYFYNGVSISNGVNVHVHFEANRLYDMQIGTDEGNDGGSKNQGQTNIAGSFFSTALAPEKSIIFGKYQVISITNTWLSKPLQPLTADLTSDTTVYAFGNFNSFYELPDEFNNIRNISLISFKKGESRFNNAKVNELKATRVVTGNVDYDEGLAISKKGSGRATVNISEDSILPNDLLTNFGGRWNRWKNVYTQGLYVSSPDGNMWKINVSDTGAISAVKS